MSVQNLAQKVPRLLIAEMHVIRWLTIVIKSVQLSQRNRASFYDGDFNL